MLILGMGALARPDGAAVLAAAREIAAQTGMVAEGWNGFNVLHTAAARVGGLDLGFVPGPGGKGTADILAAPRRASSRSSTCSAPTRSTRRSWEGLRRLSGPPRRCRRASRRRHPAGRRLHGEERTYVNTEGRVQLGSRAVFPPGEAREDWAILRALSGALGKPLPYDTQDALREALRREFPASMRSTPSSRRPGARSARRVRCAATPSARRSRIST